MKFVLVYLVFVNLLSYFLMYYDKSCAKFGHWRIPERTLWGVAFAGGSMGGMLGMYRFRHKTKHLQFRYGFPIVAVMEGIFLLWLLFS